MEIDESLPDPRDLLKQSHPRRWEIFVYGESNSCEGGVGIVFTSPAGERIVFCFRMEYKATNNKTKFEAVIQALRIAIEMELDEMRITSDTQLVVRRIEGVYNAVDLVMKIYQQLVQDYSTKIRSIIWRNINRDNNRHEDALTFKASMIENPKIWHIVIQWLMQPSVSREEKELQVMMVEERNTIMSKEDWRTPIYKYLTKGDLPRDRQEAKKVKSKSTNYKVREGILYRRSFLGPLMRCLSQEEGIKIMKSIHYGDAGNHSGTRLLAYKTRTHGYFWSYMHKDAKDISIRCEGIDIVGPFVTGTKQRRYLIVATDYFTKWVEAKAVQHTKDGDIYDFILENIICRFGIPVLIVSYNGKQFEGENVKMLFNAFKIQSGKSTPLYPQSNGQAEDTNKTVASMLKKKGIIKDGVSRSRACYGHIEPQGEK
ncbi:uncharacterized protein LOC113316658 [Papaver somniferum]|uniref:uncharacterized protein LOC113316658 n=1 Tax=Papaver somniferum TaxID=3469 RepID=UPI000E6FE429|nr:uncharacterized protein LOC113316658 [Papaver somniferum]